MDKVTMGSKPDGPSSSHLRPTSLARLRDATIQAIIPITLVLTLVFWSLEALTLTHSIQGTTFWEQFISPSAVDLLLRLTQVSLILVFCWLVKGSMAQRQEAERGLRQSEERFRRLFEESNDAVILHDLEGRIRDVNGRTCELVGRSREELLSLTIWELEGGEVPRNGRERIMKRIGEGQVRFKSRFSTPDGRFVEVDVSARVVNLDQGVVQAIARDITQQMEDHRALQAAKETADSANRAKSEFLANMSHEIRTPMNGIIGMTELAMDTELSQEQREYLEIVRQSSHSLLRIINDILDFSKIEARKLDLEEIPFDLRSTIEEAIQTLAVKADEKDLELIASLAPDIPRSVRGDPGRLRQVLVNLLGNAVKFTRQGEVILSVEVEPAPEGCTGVRIQVTDTGPGISEEKLGHIFEAFRQADGSVSRVHGGTGLGLSISSRIVGLMGGRLEVESQVDRGSTFAFSVSLPLEDDPEPLPLASQERLKGLRTLIVDDNRTNREVLRRTLSNLGALPEAVPDGPSALGWLEQAGRPCDLILLDRQMPGADGFEVARRIRRLPREGRIPIILLTSVGQRGDAQACSEVGIDGYLLKPVRFADLQQAILTVMGGEEPPDPSSPPPLVTRHSLREQRSARGRNILLVEDNRINQKVATRMLEKEGHRISLAENGLIALERVGTERFDLILMDVQMPIMDGIEATRAIRELEKGTEQRIPIIAMTAHAMKGDRERCLEAGMDDYVTKPIKLEKLQVAIQRIMPPTEEEAR